MLKVNFKTSEKYDIEIMKRYALPGRGDWNWSDHVFLFHPKLRQKLKNIKLRKEKERVIERYVREFYDREIFNLNKKKEYFKREWKKINNQYEKALCELMEINPVAIKIEATCIISICPICPRDLKKKTFSVFYKQKIKQARLTIAHEILHFYYFYKWKKIFQKNNEKNFDGPHIIWHLSEILAPVILNTKRIQKLLREKARGYKEHEAFKIKGKNSIAHFKELYSKYGKEGFSEFLKKAYMEIKKYKKEIQKI